MDRFKFIAEKNFDELPKTSGVYSFYNKNEVLYIGKAINIQNRVKNHFNQPSDRDDVFISQVNKIGYFETDSEIEALILEANLIKKHQPKFNVVWRDDKNYFYVAIINNEQKIPYVFITHQPNLQTTHYKLQTIYIGPFVEGTSLKKVLRFLRKVFPYYTSKKHNKNKCAYCHLDLCPGPLLFENPSTSSGLREYRRNIKKLILILQGKRNAVLNSLKREMKILAKENKFEEAGKARDKIHALQQVMSHTHVINSQPNYQINYQTNTCRNHAIACFLHVLAIPAEKSVNRVNRIECYDVSNIQGKQATGSMVVFIDGAPDRNLYRKFKIRLPEKPNDVAMLKETLQRRLAHPEWKYPEVILIDGGKAQLNTAIKIKNSKNYLKNLKIQELKIISIAKGRQELFIENRKESIPLKTLPREIYNLILQLDDEAHRFAIAYHKKLRKKELLG